MTTTEITTDQETEPTPSPCVAIFVEWGGKRFGPYSSMQEAHQYFSFKIFATRRIPTTAPQRGLSMIPAFLRSKLRRFERGETALCMVPAQATLLPDVVTSSRYAALERLYIEACHDLHRQRRIAEHLQ